MFDFFFLCCLIFFKGYFFILFSIHYVMSNFHVCV